MIKLFAQVTHLKIIDPGGAGFGLGEERVASVQLLTSKNGSMVGAGGVVCTVVGVADAAHSTGTMQCAGTYSLREGQIASQGLVALTNGLASGTHAQAITGGTGRFRTARGQTTYAFLSGVSLQTLRCRNRSSRGHRNRVGGAPAVAEGDEGLHQGCLGARSREGPSVPDERPSIPAIYTGNRER